MNELFAYKFRSSMTIEQMFDRLKTLGTGTDPRFANASVGFDMEKLEPTFKLHLGSPGSSGALAVATRMGLAKSVVERARELVGEQGVKIEDLLANVAEVPMELTVSVRSVLVPTRPLRTRPSFSVTTCNKKSAATTALGSARFSMR